MINDKIIFREVPAGEIKIDPYELAARLGIGCSCMEDVVVESLPELYEAAGARYSAIRVPVSYPGDGAVMLADERIESSGLCKNLDGAREAFLLAVTLGAGIDRYLYRLSRLSASSYFLADAAASAMAEALADIANEEVCRGLTARPRFSPGYGDLPLSIQGWLLRLVSAENLLGITLSESNLMIPKKSITAIIGIKNEE